MRHSHTDRVSPWLLNRVGRTGSDDFGYIDSGFDITFDDSPVGADVHNYGGTGGGALTGIWGSDGRNVDPLVSLDTSPRTAFLTSFNGLDPNGNWTLFVSDVSEFGTGRLESWTLEVTGSAIPEPSTLRGDLRRSRARGSGVPPPASGESSTGVVTDPSRFWQYSEPDLRSSIRPNGLQGMGLARIW